MSQETSLEFGNDHICLQLPDSADILSAHPIAPLSDAAGDIERALADPIAALPLSEMAPGRKDAAIVVSDNTRPIPYKGDAGILRPVIRTLQDSGIKEIKVIVANGTHQPMTEHQLHEMLDESAWWPGVSIINHVGADPAMLRNIGRTERTSKVTVNRHYLDAELKILTGLAEPHFMAGFSGGGKAICPGICGQDVTYGFHSAGIIDHPKSTTLLMQGNPCHEESLRIARMAGADFIVNVTLDNRKQITGVFAGGLAQAHQAAVEFLLTYVTIPIRQRYDIVVTPAGYVGLNHYQCAKAGMEASRAVKSDGAIILLADLSDRDPIGAANYREVLRLLSRSSPEDLRSLLLSHRWQFIPEQWEVQMWARILACPATPKSFYTCAPQLADAPAEAIPETNVAAQNPRRPGENDREYAQRMLQETLDQLTTSPDKTLLVLPDGPYAVPVLTGD